ncbi:MAG: X-Pro dipeptidyl-peptidase [Acidimicrobiales bacterium]|nr:X-Pro dipeptidyl-peptidase [Acidimicrobiales bacterium]
MGAGSKQRGDRVVAGMVAVVACVALLAAACSSGASGGASGDSATKASSSTTTAGTAPADDAGGAHPCAQGATGARPVLATEVPLTGKDSGAKGRTDLDVTSFDGAKIRTHWFPVDGATKSKPVPTVLMGPGWSLPGDTSTDGAALFGAASIKGLRDDGYNVLTWDPRGFGQSGGEAMVDDADFEGRDVRILMDWVSEQPEAQLDGKGDPRLGMVGFSYGGGIQLSVASVDCRVDALVPGLAWHSLHTSLYKAETVKAGWSKFLYEAAVTAGGHLAPNLVDSATNDLPKGIITPPNIDWYESRGPGDRIDDIDVPTLFVQGTVDTLFSLDEAVTNYRSLRDRGVPTAMLWFCGGHGTCLNKEALKDDRFSKASLAWLDRYLKGDRSVELGPGLDLVDQDGTRWTADAYPVPLADPVVATGKGDLGLVATGGSGPLTEKPPAGDVLGGLVGGITPAKATNAVNVTIDPGKVDGLAIGAPILSITYEGTVKDGPEPVRAFAQLIDDDTGRVVGNQITPFKVTLDGVVRTATIPLEVIAQHLEPGHTLTLQIVATTTAYSVPRLGGEIGFSRIRISLPVAKDLRPAART